MFYMRTCFFLLYLCWECVAAHTYKAQGQLKQTNRIVGGQPVLHRSQFAYQVSLRYNSWPICGGSIINNRHLLTAAHCLTNERGRIRNKFRFLAVVGDLHTNKISPTTVMRRLLNIFLHEKYNHSILANDVAVLRIQSLIFNAHINSIPLAAYLPAPMTKCTISGWGLTGYLGEPSSVLLFTRVSLLYRISCIEAYGPNLLRGMICAGAFGSDTCSGDSGGPLVCEGFQVGIVSWGYICGKPEFPGVYASVPTYFEWIEAQEEKSTTVYAVAHGYVILLNVILYIYYTYFIYK